MIPISGMSNLLAMQIVDATEDRQQEMIKAQPQHARAIDSFRERISDVETVDQLMEDYELYSFVMRAFDLEDQIFGKAMVEQALKSNIEERDALINRLTDPRMKEMYQVLGFGENGEGNLNTILRSWQDDMVARYVDTQFVNAQAEQNDAVGTALAFRRNAAEIGSPFDILKDQEMGRFFRRVLGLPDQMVQLDIDRQAEILTEKYDLEKLKDPEEVDRLVTRYLAVSEALDGTATANNPVVQLMGGATSLSAGNTDFSPVLIDISGISAVRGGY